MIIQEVESAQKMHKFEKEVLQIIMSELDMNREPWITVFPIIVSSLK